MLSPVSVLFHSSLIRASYQRVFVLKVMIGQFLLRLSAGGTTSCPAWWNGSERFENFGFLRFVISLRDQLRGQQLFQLRELLDRIRVVLCYF